MERDSGGHMDNTWKLIYIVVIMLYSGATGMAVITSMNKRRETIFKKSNITMVSGCVFMGISLLRCFFVDSIYLAFLLLGLLLLHMAAIMNGMQSYGKVNTSHHIVRAIISLCILYFYYKL
jgi:hypothetical protein